MVENINKQIEEEAIVNNPQIFLIEHNCHDLVLSRKGVMPYVYASDMMKEYHAHSSRWRKVSEELPELGIEVIITRNDGIRFLAWLDKDSELFFNVSGNEEYFLDEIQSWKPID